MNFYDVILAVKLQDVTYPANFFDLLFARKFMADVWQTYEGTLPATITANGDDMRTYQVYGNVGGVGGTTANLFDNSLITNDYPSNTFGTISLNLKPNTTYVLWTTAPRYNNGALLMIANTTGGASTAENGAWLRNPREWTTDNTGAVKILYRGNNSGYDLTTYKYSLTEGSTAPASYIPYGYEVPMSVFGNYKRVHEDTVTINGIVWDILGYDHDTVYKSDNTVAQHTVTIQTHDCLLSMEFDAREALFAFDNGLSAGTYFFTVGSQPWYSADINKNIQFTLANGIPPGGQLVINSAYNTTMVNTTISAYADCAAITASETVIMTEGNNGISLGTANDALSNDGVCNSIQRALLGSNRWSQSALRQYLNSSADAGSVWSPQTKWDRPPSWIADTAGFLHNFDSDFIAVLGASRKATALNTVTDGGGTELTSDYVFLLSRTEAYAGKENGVADGTPYPYYSDFSSLSQAGSGSDSNRIKTISNPKTYWLRTPDSNTARTMRNIDGTGRLSQSGATNLKGISPACTIVLDDIASNDWLKNIFLSSKITTPIYIGDTALQKDEYIDYKAQKIYRKVNNVLTPTDPPVALPTLPTCEGTTIVDYAGQSVAVPEKAVFEYRKEGTKWENYLNA